MKKFTKDNWDKILSLSVSIISILLSIGTFINQQNIKSQYNDTSNQVILMTPSRKSRDFSHGMDRPLLSPFMGLFVCFCIFLVIDIFLYNFFAHIAQCTHIVTWRPKMTAPILATSYFWMIL